ncbi:putative peptidase YqhT [Paenibacillus sp. J31TS4]|uniref:M24 family metallopeptidase n=1 Tax=Paenibacillus sp. J31TS4 TaxID=2807195 RepID=UPI001B0C9439|nr:Xaa-Pro peptidase family protein [Paenibacillus sp. J31TS4]GIP37624.1 putative peptidase YqhT [Paenibacillus sp. J31TS4]
MTQARVAKLRQSLAELGLEAIVLTNSHNRRYITGFTGSSGYVLVTADRAFLLTDFRYMTQAAEQAAGFEIVEHNAKVMLTVRELLSDLGISRVGFEQNDVTFGTYVAYKSDLGSIELVPTEQVVERLRMYKDAEELRIMREAAKLADDTFAYILTKLKPGVSERAIALEMEMYMRSHGATSSSFDTIVASGERSALPHGVASDRLLGSNEYVKLDFGAYYQGYCSDLTRTVCLGEPTDKHKDIYKIVLEAQMNVLENLKPGMTGREGDALARDIIRKYGYGDHFGHGTGHSLGMQVHEAPRLSPSCDTVLEPGMTMTVEPGIYLPGFGGVRIEDDVVLTESGNERLTFATKEFLVLG